MQAHYIAIINDLQNQLVNTQIELENSKNSKQYFTDAYFEQKNISDTEQLKVTNIAKVLKDYKNSENEEVKKLINNIEKIINLI